MLGSAVPATASLHATTSNATPTSPTRSNRLRGLSYLRSYTRDHLSASPRGATLPDLEPSISAPSARSRTNTTRRVLSPSREQEESLQRREAERIAERARQNGETGWLPTLPRRTASGPVYGDSFTESTVLETTPSYPRTVEGMTRGRAASAQTGPTATPVPSSRSIQRRSSHAEGIAAELAPQTPATGSKESSLPSIRFIPHNESRSSRPSLHFTAVSRTLKRPQSVVRVGRYSERDTNPEPPTSSTSPVGFKSKVVSRRHCEFWCSNGQWYVKDVKSSSGTFLNHVRLSSPGVESRPYPVNDGDVVQLGIDFKGGEEVIFRCVKIRIECNRGWQKSLNNFNTSAHKRLLMNNKGRDSDAASTNSSECSICLNPVAPCQALFVAPCSHVWHFKCIRNLILGQNGPNFLCPNCRFVADLEADVEPPEDYPDGSINDSGGEESEAIPEEDEHDMELDHPDTTSWMVEQQQTEADCAMQEMLNRERSPSRRQQIPEEELVDMFSATSLRSRTRSTGESEASNTRSGTRPMTISIGNRSESTELLAPRSATPTSSTQFALTAGVMNMPSMPNTATTEGPATPRNAAGPFVFDGYDDNDNRLGAGTGTENGSEAESR